MRLSLTERAAQAVLARARDAEVEGWLLRIAEGSTARRGRAASDSGGVFLAERLELVIRDVRERL